MSDVSTIIAELEALQEYEVYEPIVRYLAASAPTLYVWDFVLTFHDEVTILWGTKWSTSRTLFFINRYFSLAAIISFTYLGLQTNPTLHTCLGFASFSIVGILLISNIEIILLRRLFVLYDHKRVIVVPMVILYIGVFGGMMGMAIAFSVYSKARDYVIAGICVEEKPHWFLPFWIPLMAFDFIIMALAGFKSVQRYRRVPDKSWFSARFMRVLARDSFVYFAFNTLNYLFTTLILFQVAPPELYAIGASWTVVIPPFAANHLLINMEYSRFKSTSFNDTNTGTSIGYASSGHVELKRCDVQSSTTTSFDIS